MAFFDRIRDALGGLGERVARAIDPERFEELQEGRKQENERERQADDYEREHKPRLDIDVSDIVDKLGFGQDDWPSGMNLQGDDGRVHMDIDYQIVLQDGEVISGHIERYNYDNEDLIRRMILASEGEVDSGDILEMYAWVDDDYYEYDENDFADDGDSPDLAGS